MKTQSAYCSACAKNVRIVIASEASQSGHASLRNSEIVCLDIGAHCRESLCPVGGTSPAVMAARLVRTGLHMQMNLMIKRHCDGCGVSSTFATLDAKYATCTVCGTTISWRSHEQPPRDDRGG